MTPPPEPPRTVGELEEQLGGLEERDDLARLVIAYLRQRFSRVLFFMVRGGEVAGWLGEGEDVDEEILRRFDVGFEVPSLFLNLKAGTPFYRGPLPAMEAHRKMAKIWGGKRPAECVAFGVTLKGRLISAVYADKGPHGLGNLDFGEVNRIAAATSHAFEQFIVRRKQH